MAILKRPPRTSVASITIGSCPSLAQKYAADKPSTPPPIIAIFFSVAGALYGITLFLFSLSRSQTKRFKSFMATGSSASCRLHSISQKAGQILPITLGKGFLSFIF